MLSYCCCPFHDAHDYFKNRSFHKYMKVLCQEIVTLLPLQLNQAH